MKKLLFVFTALISLVTYSTSSHADGVVKIYKNGSCTVFQANEVDSVVFASSDSSDDEYGIETLYGTWQQTNGYAIEDGEKHHEKNVDADEAEYLKFDANGTCLVYGGDRGLFYDYTYQSKSFSFNFDQEKMELIIGDRTFVVEILNSGTLKLKEYDNNGSGDAIVATYKKTKDGVWD